MLFALIILFLLFGRRRYWGGYGYPFGYGYGGYGGYGYHGYGYSQNAYGYGACAYPYGAFSPYNPYYRQPYCGYYRPHRW